MVPGRQVQRAVRRLDRQLRRLERQAITRLDGALRAAGLRLEQQLRGEYIRTLEELDGGPSVGAAIAEARARALLGQVRGLLTLTSGVPADEVFTRLTRDAHEAGLANAVDVLEPYQRRVARLNDVVPVDVAAAATRVSTRLVEIGDARVANAQARLVQHGREAAERIERHVTDGIIRGQGWRRTAREVRREVGITRFSAERIVRTESVTASDTARRELYVDTGVEHVQIVVTMDERLCGYCANRAGRVYKIEDVELPYHPQCRCFSAPWRREWQEAGLTDDEWHRQHRRESLDRAEEAQRTGPSPSERWRGLESSPTPVWSP